MRKTVFPTLCVLVAMASASDAATMAAGALFAGPAQKLAVCSVYNSGATAVTLSNFKITFPTGAALAVSANTCGAFPFSLAAGRSCEISSAIAGIPYNCTVDVAPGKAAMRGTFQYRDTNGNALQTIDLH